MTLDRYPCSNILAWGATVVRAIRTVAVDESLMATIRAAITPVKLDDGTLAECRSERPFLGHNDIAAACWHSERKSKRERETTCSRWTISTWNQHGQRIPHLWDNQLIRFNFYNHHCILIIIISIIISCHSIIHSVIVSYLYVMVSGPWSGRWDTSSSERAKIWVISSGVSHLVIGEWCGLIG